MPKSKAPLDLAICHCGVSFQITLMVDVWACPVHRLSKECNSYTGNERVILFSNLLESKHGLEMGGLGNRALPNIVSVHC